MVGFILKRLVQSVFVMLAVAFLAFSLFRFVGDPISQMTGVETSLEDQARLREDLGLNDPYFVQFARFTGDMLRGDFGYSFRTREPIGEMLLSRLPATLELGVVALLVSLVVGILPIFLFGVQLGWLPTFGRGGTVEIGWWRSSLFTAEGWRSLVLPALTLGLFQLTLTMRLVRAQMMEVMRTDHIRFAIARGVPWRSIRYRHALSNTMIPVITIIGLQFGGVIAFSIVTESVFQWPGMGLLFLESIRFVDIPVMSVYLVVIAFFFVLINLLVDLLYVAIDPRLRVRESV